MTDLNKYFHLCRIELFFQSSLVFSHNLPRILKTSFEWIFVVVLAFHPSLMNFGKCQFFQ